MHEITVAGSFCAVHRTRLPDGSVEPVHGHDWRVTARLAADTLDANGLVADFVEVQARLGTITSEFQHRNLNEHDWLAGVNPTAEHVARVIFERLSADTVWGHLVRSVHVEEAPGCTAGYLRR